MNAAVIVIGNEVLAGQVDEANATYLCQKLFDAGIQVGKVEIIADVMEEIVTSIQTLHQKFKK